MSDFIIPYGKQSITQEDINAVIETLQSDYLTQGPKIAEFEQSFANYVQANYAVAVSSGTAALHLNSIALGVKPGDKVITTPITFSATANCVRYCGGDVVFADIDLDTYLLDIKSVRTLLENDYKKEIKGIIPVHFAGRVADMEAFRILADEFGCWIIEDACHSPGGFFIDSNNQIIKAGSGKYAELSIFSFHPVKHIAAGEGGMITTNNKVLYKRLLDLRTHGITRDDNKFQNPIEVAIGGEKNVITSYQEYPNWYMEMQSLGYNYRLTDIQAALGNSQLKRAEVGLIRRKELAENYFRAFQDIPQIEDKNVELMGSKTALRNGHAYHLYVVETKNRLELYNYLRKNSIYAQIHYFPCHLMPYYKNIYHYKEGDIPNAELYYNNCISLPMYPTLSSKEQNYIIDKIINFFKNSKTRFDP